MRIGVVTTSYPRYAGDPAGHFVAGLNRCLVQRGHTIEVLAAGDGACDLAGRPPRPACEAVWRVPSKLFYRGGAPDALSKNAGSTIGPWLEAGLYCARIGRLLKARQHAYDALISHWLVPCGILSTAFSAGRPHVAIAHSSDVHLLRRWGLLSVARFIAQRARLVYTSASLCIPGAPGLVAPMGIDASAFRATADERAAARARLSANAKTVLFLGRLVPVKGVHLLVSVLASLPTLDLWIAGDGPLLAELRRAASPLGRRARFFGEVDAPTRRELLLACDVLAVPSLLLPDGRTEGAPQVVLEGLAAGCAVVASAVGGIPELLGDAGWLVPPGDAPALTAALKDAIGAAQQGDVRNRAMLRAGLFDWSFLAPKILGAPFIVPPAG